MARILARIAIIAAVAALFVGLTGIYADSIPPGKGREPRRRAAEARLSRFPSFAGQCGLVVLIAFVGRKAFRLRL